MSLPQQISGQEDGGASAESRGSTTPLINKNSSVPSTDLESTQSSQLTDSDGTTKPRKRDFWKLGKKQEEDKLDKSPAPSPGVRPSAAQIAPIAALRPSSPLRSADSLGTSASPHRASYPYTGPGSPGYPRNASPRPQSPASSMIFERNVQEDDLPPEMSPHIPSHVITENHIAPALDASTEAITNPKLNADEVEIVTHSSHQPAAVTITGAGTEHSLASSMHDDFSHTAELRNQRHDSDNASNYGSLDNTDVRRLSFISFADVVHAEQEHGDQRRDSAHLAHPLSLAANRSPSPVRSPVSSAAFGTSPPTSVSASFRGMESSPSRAPRTTGSPLPGQSSPLGGELNIETMRQALRKTGSGDLSGFRSAPLSAVGNDDGTYDKTNR